MAMKYSEIAATGDASEYFFAYKIASILRWPCRLLDIDIGIDAQVEIIDMKTRVSTGKFVAFQVKGTRSDGVDSRYVSERQLAYWRDLALPVYVVLVDLPEQAMFLHRVQLNFDYPEATEKSGVLITFDRIKDRFDESYGGSIAAVADEETKAHTQKIHELLETASGGVAAIRHAIEGPPDVRRLIELMDFRHVFAEAYARARELVETLGIEEDAFNAVELDEALEELREYMKRKQIHIDHDEDGRITRFVRQS
jgi:Domain of unknown function (DUF4365)